MPYKPRPGTLPHKVITWLHENAGEELTASDVAKKWSTTTRLVTEGLNAAVTVGVLRLETNSDSQWVYRLPVAPSQAAVRGARPFAGAVLSAPEPPAAPAKRAPGSTSHRGRVVLHANDLDFSGLKADAGVPVVGITRSADGVSKWQPLFDLLTRPDTSVEFPAAWKTAVGAQACKFNRAAQKAGQPTRYTVRRTSALKARIWRTA